MTMTYHERRRVDWQKVALFSASAVMSVLMIIGALDVARAVAAFLS